MTRVMGTATHGNVSSLPRNLQLVSGYDTGTPDIQWTPGDWARFPGIPHIHIDQGFGDTRAIEAHVIVFDVEPLAFRPDQAKAIIDANASVRPTIYVNRGNITATIASALQSKNWKGDIWLAYPGWKTGLPVPSIPPGCRYVAIQDVFGVSYQLSTVLDNSWPGPLPLPDEPPDWRDQALSRLNAIMNELGSVRALIATNTP